MPASFAAEMHAQTTAAHVQSSTNASVSAWSFYFNVSGYLVPHDRSYASPVFTGDHTHIHLEARYNYEDSATGSLWIGYNLSTGDKIVLEATPMVGAVVGNTTGVAPGYRASLSWNQLELSTEGEYVFDTRQLTGSFFYVWTELSYSPADWLRGGMAIQRTKAYHTGFDIQRGVFLGISHGRVELTTYLLNLGWTHPTLVLSLGFSF